jgi:mono/diheme cytochrome c family protein
LKRWLILVFCFTLILAGLTACGGTQSGTAPTPAPAASAPTGDAVDYSDGKLVYKNYCLTCHGGNLQGGRGASLMKIGERATQEMIADKIKNGGGGMPSFKVSLKEEDIEAVAAWLATIKE